MSLRVAGGGGGGAGAIGGISAGTSSVSSGSITFSNSNGVSFGLSNGVITATVTPGAAAGIAAIQMSNSTYTSGTANFSNANGISFGSSAPNAITASYTVPGATVFSNSNNVSFGLVGSTVTASATVSASSLSFSNLNGVTFGTAGSTLTASVAAQSSSSLSFSNANGITFGTAGSTLTASYNSTQFAGLGTTFAGTNASASMTLNSAGLNLAVSAAAGGGGGGIDVTFGGNTSGALALVSTGTLFIAGGNNITVSQNANSVTISGANAGGAQTGISSIAVSNTTYTNGLVSLVNANGISFGSSGASGISASYTVPTQSVQSIGLFASSQTTGQSSSSSIDARSFSIVGAGVISVGFSAGSFIVSSPGTTNIAGFAVSNTTQSSSGTLNVGSLSFAGAGGVSVGISNGSVVISGGAGGGGGAAISAGTQSTSGGTVVFSNSNGISFGMSNSSIVTASYTVPGATSFSNLNGVTFGLAGSTITASVATQISTVGLFALGNTTQNSSTSLNQSAMSFNALGAMTMGYSNGSIQVSAPATSSLSGTGGISISVNGSTISIGINSLSALPPLNTNFYAPYEDYALAPIQIGQGSLLFDPQPLPAMQFDRVVFPIYNTNSSLSSGSHSISMYFGLYTINGSTLSQLASVSGSTAVTQSGTLGSYSLYSGLRNFSIGMTTTLTSGNYWIAFASRTSSGGADGSYSNMVLNNNFFTDALLSGTLSYGGIFGASVNATNQFLPGQGFYTATTTGMPASVALSQINGTASNAFNAQAVAFRSQTF